MFSVINKKSINDIFLKTIKLIKKVIKKTSYIHCAVISAAVLLLIAALVLGCGTEGFTGADVKDIREHEQLHIKNISTNKYLGIFDSEKYSLLTTTSSNTAYTVVDAGAGRYRFVNKQSGKGFIAIEDSEEVQYGRGSVDGASWKIEKFSDGRYGFRSVFDTYMYLDGLTLKHKSLADIDKTKMYVKIQTSSMGSKLNGSEVDSLTDGTYLRSDNGTFKAEVYRDTWLKVFNLNTEVKFIDTPTNFKKTIKSIPDYTQGRLVMQTDGNLVFYIGSDNSAENAKWSSGTFTEVGPDQPVLKVTNAPISEPKSVSTGEEEEEKSSTEEKDEKKTEDTSINKIGGVDSNIVYAVAGVGSFMGLTALAMVLA